MELYPLGKPIRGKKRLIITADEDGRMVEQFIDRNRTVMGLSW